MKNIILALMLTGFCQLWAQEPAEQPPATQNAPTMFSSNLKEKVLGPTYNDSHCAGFLSSESVPEAHYVIAGKEHGQTLMKTHDTVFLTGGGYEVGDRFRIIRRIGNPTHDEFYPGQIAQRKHYGTLWDDISIVKVENIINGVAVAKIEFSCSDTVAGDIVLPYTEPPELVYSRDPAKFQVWQNPTPGTVTGQIIETQEYDFYVGRGHKVYLTLGSDKGLKPGDYLRITRSYSDSANVPAIDKNNTENNVKDASNDGGVEVKSSMRKVLPKRGIGELMVLSVTPKTATAIITLSLEDLHVGDYVELEK